MFIVHVKYKMYRFFWVVFIEHVNPVSSLSVFTVYKSASLCIVHLSA